VHLNATLATTIALSRSHSPTPGLLSSTALKDAIPPSTLSSMISGSIWTGFLPDSNSKITMPKAKESSLTEMCPLIAYSGDM
jgi:hypothetical protein